MSRKFTLWENPYDDGNLYKKKEIEIRDGLTILCGCNGIGKTTLLNNIKEILEDENIPVISFDNLHDGGNNARSKAGFHGDFGFLGTSLCSSEGENIMMNMNKLASKLGFFVKYGKERQYEKDNTSKERWVLLDAIDSGFSVDNVIDIKENLLKFMLENNMGANIHIVVSANEYEMANGEQCFDVFNGEYITFDNYEEYKQMILESKKNKQRREKENEK